MIFVSMKMSHCRTTPLTKKATMSEQVKETSAEHVTEGCDPVVPKLFCHALLQKPKTSSGEVRKPQAYTIDLPSL